MTVRLSVNVNDETVAVLKSIAARRGSTVTDEIRRAAETRRF